MEPTPVFADPLPRLDPDLFTAIRGGDGKLGPSVSHIVVGLGKDQGGPSYSVPALTAALARRGMTIRLRCVEGAKSQEVNGVAWSVHPVAANPLGKALRISSDLRQALIADARAGAILHAHGLWLMPSIYPALAKRRSNTKAKLVHAPRGMLGQAALKISSWKKKPFWWLLQRSALEAADCLHATAFSEYEEIRAAGLKNPVAIVPNGIDLPSFSVIEPHNRVANTVLSLGRIHPKKGLDRLLHAWALIEEEFPAWRLKIAGPNEGRHGEDLRLLARTLGLHNVSFAGAVYGAEKLQLFQEAELFVLPTLNENFAMTVAESLAATTPVISTKGAPWAGLETNGCGWWIDHGPEALAATLRQAMSLTVEERRVMGERGRAWMERDFTWQGVADQMAQVYRWLVTGGELPSCVKVN